MSDVTPKASRSSGAGKASATPADPLQTELAALMAQRAKDLERLRAVTADRDRLRFELAERNAAESGALARQRERGKRDDDDDEEDDDRVPAIDGWLLKAGVIRARARSEEAPKQSVFSRILASVILRFARKAAKRQDYATAEVFYQTILMLAPRAFIWRQLGNMLAGQGLYAAAVECFDRVLEVDQTDAATFHARGQSLRRCGERDAAAESLRRAIALDPSLADLK